MKRVLLRFGLAFLLLSSLGASGWMCSRVAERGRYAAPYSSFGSGPDGSRALLLLAEEQGREAERWTRDLGGLPEGGILVALGGCDAPMRRAMSGFEASALIEWVEQGGVLIVAGVEGYLPDELGVRLRHEDGQCGELAAFLAMLEEMQEGDADEAPGEQEEGEEGLEERVPQAFGPNPVGEVEEIDDSLPPVHWADVSDKIFDGLGALPVREPAMIHVDEDLQSTRLLDLEGAAAAVAVPIGAGTVYAISSASLLQNREMLVTDGGAMIARIWRRHPEAGPVRFDEYHLGVGTTRSIVQYTRELGAGAVWLQLLIILAFVFWRRGTRFGAPRVDLPPIPGGTASYLESLGRLYRRSGDGAAALKIVGAHALGRIAAHHHLEGAESEALSAALETRDADAAEAVRAIETKREETIENDRELLSHARAIDAIVARQVDHQKTRR